MRRIALVTSRTGAAVRDMVTVIQRRFPRVTILVPNPEGGLSGVDDAYLFMGMSVHGDRVAREGCVEGHHHPLAVQAG